MEHLMTSEEIAELLHIDPVTVRRLVNKGELSAYRIGADYRFAPSDLQDYLQRQRISAHSQDSSSTNLNNPLEQFTQLLRKVLQGKHITPTELVDYFDRSTKLDRFTKRARHVLTLAQQEAQRFQHNYIGTEHLLLGLLREGEGVAAHVLSNLGIEVDQVRHAIEAIIGRGGRIVRGEMGFTPRAKKVIELAVDEARRLNHHYIGTEHILLGLLREGEGIAAGVLESLGVRLEQARRETLAVLGVSSSEMQTTSPPTPEESASLLAESEPKLICPYCGAYLAEGESSLICSHCGTHCPGYFHYCFNCGERLVYE